MLSGDLVGYMRTSFSVEVISVQTIVIVVLTCFCNRPEKVGKIKLKAARRRQPTTSNGEKHHQSSSNDAR